MMKKADNPRVRQSTIKKTDLQDIIESKIEDAHTEVLIVGSLFQNPDLLLDYKEKIVPKYDFYHDTTKFLYNSLMEIYYYQTITKNDKTSTKIDEVKINIYMNQDEDRKKKWKELKGYSYIERIMSISNPEEFTVYFNEFKKFSLLREFERKGYPAQKLYESKQFVKWKPEDIVKNMEIQINTIGTIIGGLQESIILGKDMKKQVKKWKETPDFGLDIPFVIINQLIRGWRQKKLLLLGLHSGCGKSRITSHVACYIGILQQEPILVLVNEQDKDEWDAMILSCVINNAEYGFSEMLKKSRILGIDETKILTGTCSEKEQEVVDAAAEWIEENSCIHFMVLDKFDHISIKREIKKHKIRNKVNHIIYDTLKAPDHDWQSFVKTGDMLKEVSMELDIGVWATFQLTDDSLFDEILTSQAIANGKHIKHVADALFMARPLNYAEYQKYSILQPENDLNDPRVVELDTKKDYYIWFMDKNRGGKDKDRIVLNINKGRNYWKEEGFLIESDDEKELKELTREFKRMKKEKDVRNMRKQTGKEAV